MGRIKTNRTKSLKKDSIANIAKYATPDEAAEILEVTSRTIRRMLDRGELQGARVGGHFKISRASIADIVRRIEGNYFSSSPSPTTETGASAPALAAQSHE